MSPSITIADPPKVLLAATTRPYCEHASLIVLDLLQSSGFSPLQRSRYTAMSFVDRERGLYRRAQLGGRSVLARRRLLFDWSRRPDQPTTTAPQGDEPGSGGSTHVRARTRELRPYYQRTDRGRLSALRTRRPRARGHARAHHRRATASPACVAHVFRADRNRGGARASRRAPIHARGVARHAAVEAKLHPDRPDGGRVAVATHLPRGREARHPNLGRSHHHRPYCR